MRLHFVSTACYRGGLVPAPSATASAAAVVSARGIGVAGSGFEVRVHDQADRIFPSRDALMRMVEIFRLFAIVVMVVIGVGVGGVEMTHVALA